VIQPSLRRIVPRILRVAPLVLLGALPASAQQDPFLKLDPTSRLAIEMMMDSAKVGGLCDSLLRSKTYEGVKKGAESKKIVEAVRSKFGHVKTAASVLGIVGCDELDAAATVLAAGAKPAQLGSFRARQKGRTDLGALTVWADLINRGVPDEEASSAITKLWLDGADEAVFLRLWKDVQGDISQGLNPGAALQARLRDTPVRTTTRPVTPPEG